MSGKLLARSLEFLKKVDPLQSLIVVEYLVEQGTESVGATIIRFLSPSFRELVANNDTRFENVERFIHNGLRQYRLPTARMRCDSEEGGWLTVIPC